MKRIEIGQYLVVDPEICHGKLTFKGTRIMVEQVLLTISGASCSDDGHVTLISLYIIAKRW